MLALFGVIFTLFLFAGLYLVVRLEKWLAPAEEKVEADKVEAEASGEQWYV